MAIVEYGSVKVVIGTMSWGEALKLTKAFIGFVEHSTDEPDTILNTIGAYFALYAPHKVYRNDQLIENGSHECTVDDETFVLELPLTVENFHALPGPLVGDWIEAATEQNDWLLKKLDFMVGRLTSNPNASPPASVPFSEPTKASAPTTTIG